MAGLNAGRERPIALGDAVVKELTSYNWPGNARQLITYLEKRFDEAGYTKTMVITMSMIRANMPRNELYDVKQDRFSLLEGSLSFCIDKIGKAPQMTFSTILESIISKIYVKDKGLPVTKSSDILGIDGSSGKASTLIQRLKQYPEVKKMLTDQ